MVAGSGDRLVANARRLESLEYLPDRPDVLKLQLDVTSSTQVETCMGAVMDKFERLDLVVNNAGYGLLGDTESSPNSEARLQLETNFWDPVNITIAALPVLRE